MKLWKHQEDGIAKARQIRNLAIFFKPGKGKTFTTLAILKEKEALYKRELKTLILCPPSVVHQWKTEIYKFYPDHTQPIVLLEGTGRQRIKKFEEAKTNSIFVLNYEGFSRITDLYDRLMAWVPEILIADESHKTKSPTTLVTKRLHKLAQRMETISHIHHKYILTGSPVLNNEIDIWSQYYVLNLGRSFGNNFFAFRNKYFYDKNKYISHMNFPKWCFIPSKEAEFKQKLEEVSVTAPDNCIDLPDLLRIRVDVPMTKEQTDAYKDMKEDFIAFIKGKTATAPLALTKALRLQQIVSGFVKTDDGTEIIFENTPRETALQDLLETITESGEKVIIWAVFKQNYKTIRRVCEKLKLKYVELTGESKENRVDSVKAFQEDPETKVLIGHPGSGGIGVNLTAAKYSIWWSRGFALEHEIQATARNHRGGSEIHDKIIRYDLVTPKTLDETVMQALENKKDLAERLLDLKNMVDG